MGHVRGHSSNEPTQFWRIEQCIVYERPLSLVICKMFADMTCFEYHWTCQMLIFYIYAGTYNISYANLKPQYCIVASLSLIMINPFKFKTSILYWSYFSSLIMINPCKVKTLILYRRYSPSLIMINPCKLKTSILYRSYSPLIMIHPCKF